MKDHRGSHPGFFAIGVMALFFAGFLLLVILGAFTYRNTVTTRNANNEKRAINGYLLTAVRSSDASNAVSVRDSVYGSVLEIGMAGTEYARRIYLYEGTLVEDFEKSGSPLDPGNARPIGKTATFSIRDLGDRLFIAESDEGTVYFSIRSEGDGS